MRGVCVRDRDAVVSPTSLNPLFKEPGAAGGALYRVKVRMDRDVAGLECVEACSKMGSDRACAHRNWEESSTGPICFTSGLPPFAWISHTCSVPLEQMLPKRSNQG